MTPANPRWSRRISESLKDPYTGRGFAFMCLVRWYYKGYEPAAVQASGFVQVCRDPFPRTSERTHHPLQRLTRLDRRRPWA